MKNDIWSKVLFGVCIIALVVLSGLLIGLPWIVDFAFSRPHLVGHDYTIHFLVLLYVTGVPAWAIVWQTMKLSKNVMIRQPFTKSSLLGIKKITLCAAFICVCYGVSAIFINYVDTYLLIELAIIIGATFMVTLIGAVLYKLVQVAMEIQEENELTI